MYSLLSNDINNSKELNFLNSPDNSSFKERISSSIDLNRISLYIFRHYDEIDARIYFNLVCSLTCGDSLKNPLSSLQSNTLFFCLLVNINKNTSLKIKNYQQGYFLYNLYEGDYSSIIPEEDDREPQWIEINAQFPNVVDDFRIRFKIPISEFTNAKYGKKQYTLSGIDHCLITIFDTDYRIPRKLYISFFVKEMYRNRLIKNSISDILDSFDREDSDSLLGCLYCIGFVSRSNLRGIQINNGFFIDNMKICSYDSQENDESKRIVWERIGSLNVLLPNVNYIPLKNEENITLLTQ